MYISCIISKSNTYSYLSFKACIYPQVKKHGRICFFILQERQDMPSRASVSVVLCTAVYSQADECVHVCVCVFYPSLKELQMSVNSHPTPPPPILKSSPYLPPLHISLPPLPSSPSRPPPLLPSLSLLHPLSSSPSRPPFPSFSS